MYPPQAALLHVIHGFGAQVILSFCRKHYIMAQNFHACHVFHAGRFEGQSCTVLLRLVTVLDYEQFYLCEQGWTWCGSVGVGGIPGRRSWTLSYTVSHRSGAIHVSLS